MATFTLEQYFRARVPDILTLVPDFNIAMATNAAMALYWDHFFPTSPEIDETLLSERRKVLVALRAVLSAVPVFTKGLTRPQVTHAEGGPAVTKFEERHHLYKSLLPIWQEELLRLENTEGIFYEELPSVPAFLKRIDDLTRLFPDTGSVVSKGVTYVKES